MFKIIGLLAIVPLFLAATCADPKYPATTWQYVQYARHREAVMPLEWDNSLLPSVAEASQNLADAPGIYGYESTVNVYPWGQGHLCIIAAVVPAELGDERTFGVNWANDYTARKCVIDPQYRHAAIAAYVGYGGRIAEVMWLTD